MTEKLQSYEEQKKHKRTVDVSRNISSTIFIGMAMACGTKALLSQGDAEKVISFSAMAVAWGGFTYASLKEIRVPNPEQQEELLDERTPISSQEIALFNSNAYKSKGHIR